ncbi:MAG: hypothetical protein AB1757_17940 [Acidobacteriota bacterium]
MAANDSDKPDAGLGSQSDEYSGWSGNETHPNAPQGGGGPGRTRSPQPLGATPDVKKPIAPNSPAGRQGFVAGDLQYASDLPKTLILFTNPLAEYSVNELNDALFTVFGEQSAEIAPGLTEEAEAVASTILNRKSLIEKARKNYRDLLSQRLLENARATRDEATKTYEDLTKQPSKYQKEMGAEKYQSAVSAAKAAYDRATENLGAAQKKMNQAYSEKVTAESYLGATARTRDQITLSDIVKASGQYLGYEKGHGDYQNFATQNPKDQERNFKRWEAAKDALTRMVTTPIKRKPYIEFRSNRHGSRILGINEVRIGGNDFW